MRRKVFGVLALLMMLGVSPGKAELIEAPEGIEGRLGEHQSSVAAPLNLFWKYSETDDVVKLDWDTQIHSQDCTQCTMFEFNNGVQTCTQWLEFEQFFDATYTVTRKEAGVAMFETSTDESSVAYDNVADSEDHAQIVYEVFSEKPDIPDFNNEFFFCDPLEGSDQTSVIAMDENGDGVADYVVPHTPVKGDINGDGIADLVWRKNSGEGYIWLMNTEGQLESSVPIASDNPPWPDWSIEARGDVNGDGFDDLIWRHISDQHVIWFMNDQGAVGSSVALGGSGPPWDQWFVKAVGDINDDGYGDFIWRHTDGSAVGYLMDAQGQLISDVGLAPSAPATDWELKGVGDIDGDGIADLVWRKVSGEGHIWLMNTEGQLKSSVVIASDSPPWPDWNIEAVGDVNGDGFADLIWRHISHQHVIWFMNDQGLMGSSVALGGSRPPWDQWFVKAVHDINGDGYGDIIWRHTDGSAVGYLMDAQGLLVSDVGLGPGEAFIDWELEF